MTFKKNDGSLNLPKVVSYSVIIGSLATVVLAWPVAWGWCKTTFAPWTTLPAQVNDIQKSVDAIKAKLHIGADEGSTKSPDGIGDYSGRSHSVSTNQLATNSASRP